MNAQLCTSPPATATVMQQKTGLFGQPHLLYPRLYLTFVVLSSIDLIMTCEILSYAPTTTEMNPIAAAMILKYGLLGLFAYKLPMTVLNVMLIESVGRLRHRTGYRLAIAAVAITTLPPIWLMWQLTILGCVLSPDVF